MKTLIQIITLAIATIAGFKTTIKNQQEEIERLRGLVENEAADDAERDARLQTLEADLTEANSKGDELARLLNEENALPSVDPGTFNVTEAPKAPVQDLEFRDRQNETAGQGVTSGFTSPTGTAPQSGQQATSDTPPTAAPAPQDPATQGTDTPQNTESQS